MNPSFALLVAENESTPDTTSSFLLNTRTQKVGIDI
jgi:hypothetical protein